MNIFRFALALFLAGLLFVPAVFLRPPAAPLNIEDAPPSSFAISNVYRVAKLTGAGSLNATDVRYGIRGTDLGIMWDNGNGQVIMAFGDTYGAGWGGCGAGPDYADWRSNTLALSGTTDLADGLKFSGMAENREGHAKELLVSLKAAGVEQTIIPTAGISVGNRNYMHYMSVNRWVKPGVWYTNYSGLAYSDDNGQNWMVSLDTIWPNNQTLWDAPFQQAAMVKDKGFVYLFGTPNGRFGAAHLARVAQDTLLDKASYEYWDGTNWQTGEVAAARPVVPGPVGELSVQYNTYFGRWLMTYLDENRETIMLRDAPALTGPWTEPTVLVSGRDFPQLYGAFIHPWFNDGPDLYFNMSQWCAPDVSYNVSFMHATLNRQPAGIVRPSRETL